MEAERLTDDVRQHCHMQLTDKPQRKSRTYSLIQIVKGKYKTWTIFIL